jgi:hypothetical protein
MKLTVISGGRSSGSGRRRLEVEDLARRERERGVGSESDDLVPGPDGPARRPPSRRRPLEQADRLEEGVAVRLGEEEVLHPGFRGRSARRPAAPSGDDALALAARQDELAEGVHGGVEAEEALEDLGEEEDPGADELVLVELERDLHARTKLGCRTPIERRTRRAPTFVIPAICCRVTEESAKS